MELEASPDRVKMLLMGLAVIGYWFSLRVMYAPDNYKSSPISFK